MLSGLSLSHDFYKLKYVNNHGNKKKSAIAGGDGNEEVFIEAEACSILPLDAEL